jgi:uncharacterized protein (TIGR02001 family)
MYGGDLNRPPWCAKSTLASQRTTAGLFSCAAQHEAARKLRVCRDGPAFDGPPADAQAGQGSNEEFAMLMSIRGAAAATILAIVVAAPSPAMAGDDAGPGPISVSGGVTLVSDYRFRGVSLSGGDPAIQGSVTVTHASGAYAGAWASSIDDSGTDIFGDAEVDLYGGWSGSVAEGIGLDVGMLYYAYPGNAKGVDAEFFEPYATVSGQLGPVQAKLGVNYAWDQKALADESLYIHSELSSGIPTTPVTVSAHLGYTDGSLAPTLLAGANDDSAFDWSLGASATVLGKLTFGVSYVGVEGPSFEGFTDDTVVLSVGASF